jgi:hypothetical protein
LAKKPSKRKWLVPLLIVSPVITIVVVSLIVFSSQQIKLESFSDDFTSVTDDTLAKHGWFLKSRNQQFWNKRNESPGYLTLFTLRGDNWPDSLNKQDIKNLLLRKISSGCFTAEVHLSDFIPNQNWQQAGILLLEDTDFTGKSLRLSLLYNDYSGGFPTSRDVIIQGITSRGKDFDKPEELAHQLVFKLDSANEIPIKQNLKHSALRIEKHGIRFRLLYANGSMANSAFKEIISRDIDMNPRYIGLFALKGFVDSASNAPARFDLFSYKPEKCGF